MRLHLLPIGLVAPELVQRLADELPRRFAVPVVVDRPISAREHWKVPPAARFDAPAVMTDLVAEAPEDGGWWLALLEGDLVGPGIRSGCGFATVGGCCALVAMAPIVDTTPPGDDGEPVFRRLLVEAVHEVGHLAGLRHCEDPGCVMHFSTSAEDVASKPPEFCAACRARVTGAWQ